MTIWAHGSQVFDWVNLVMFVNLRQWFQVMNMDVSCTDFAIVLLKIESANGTCASIVRDTVSTRIGIAFIGIHRDTLFGSFAMLFET